MVFAFPFMWRGGIAFAIFTVLLVLAFLVPYLMFISDKDRLTERAVAKGQILISALESCVAVIRNEVYQIYIICSFTTPSGKRIRRHATQTHPDLNGKQLPALATPAYVLYFNDQDYYLL